MSEFEYEPDSPECAGVDNLARALVRGKVPEVVQALRALHALDASASKSAVALLADFLDDKTNLGGLFPFRLKFASRGKRRPLGDRMRQSADRFSIVCAVERELVHSEKVDLAVETVAKRFKRGKSTVYEALSKAKENKNAYSK